MKRRFGAGVVTAAVLAAGPELDACGDKSLSAGGIRMQRAARRTRIPRRFWRTSPPTHRFATATRELKLQETLGVRSAISYHEVASLNELRASVETGQFNIVVADLGRRRRPRAEPRVLVGPRRRWCRWRTS